MSVIDEISRILDEPDSEAQIVFKAPPDILFGSGMRMMGMCVRGCEMGLEQTFRPEPKFVPIGGSPWMPDWLRMYLYGKTFGPVRETVVTVSGRDEFEQVRERLRDWINEVLPMGVVVEVTHSRKSTR